MKGGDKLITIKGIIVPVHWDDGGKALAVAISAQDESEYLIDGDDRGRELLHFIQEEVEVSGVVRGNKDKKIISVRKYVLRKISGE